VLGIEYRVSINKDNRKMLFSSRFLNKDDLLTWCGSLLAVYRSLPLVAKLFESQRFLLSDW